MPTKKKVINTSKPWPLDGYTVESHQDLGKLTWNPDNVSLYLSDRQKTDWIGGTDLYQEVKPKPPLNSAVLKYLLDNPELIPNDWKGKDVYFWGTIYRNPYGFRVVPYLSWDDGGWYWGIIWLKYEWSGGSPSAVLASAENLEAQTSALGPLELRLAKLEAWAKQLNYEG